MSNDLNVDKELVTSIISERRKDRRWRNTRFFGWIIILLLYAVFLSSFLPDSSTDDDSDKPYVSLVRLTGVISAHSQFSARTVIPELQSAFSDKTAKGVVLLIDSPGGSPVQASIIHDKILQLKKEYRKKVVVVAEDTLASGAYLVATAADKIYVNADTLTGSIGVIMSSFGFVDAIQKLGITRRVFTAGNNKDRLDPFKSLEPNDVAKVKQVLKQVHQNFINDVIAGRGKRLNQDHQRLFSGDFWTGQQAVKLGLADGTAELWTVLKREFKVGHYKDFTKRSSWLNSFMNNMSNEVELHLMSHASPIREQAY